MTWWTTRDALIYMEQQGVKVTQPTVRNYVVKHNLGHRLSGRKSRWLINPQQFRNFVAGKIRRDKGGK